MVLYCIQGSVCVIRSVVHKFKYHPQDEAVFLVDREVSSPCCPHIDKIKYYQTPDPLETVRYGARSREETKAHINHTISDFFREISIDPLQFSDIYVLFEEYNPFVLYFEMNSVRYMSVEAADSSFSDHASGRAVSRFMYLHPEAYAYGCLIRDMHLQDAQGENCTKAYLYSERSVCDPIVGKTDAEIFGFYEALAGLDEEQKRQLTAGYNAERYDFDTVLTFGSPFYTKRSFEIHKLDMPFRYMSEDGLGAVCFFYKTLIDYYFSDADYAIKLPADLPEGFVKAFSAFKQLPSEFPTEVLSLMDKQIDIVYPDLGTDCDAHNAGATVFGGRIFDFFRYIHFTILAFTLIGAVGVPEKITVSGIDISQLDHFKNRAYKDFKDVIFERLNRHNVWDADFVVADPSEEFAEIIKNVPEDCLIFVYGDDQADTAAFAGQEMTCSLIDTSGEELQSFRWWVLSKNQGLVDAVREFSASYTLENAGVTVQTQPVA